MANIRRKANGRWVVIQRFPNGKRVSRTVRTRREADMIAYEFELLVRSGTPD